MPSHFRDVFYMAKYWFSLEIIQRNQTGVKRLRAVEYRCKVRKSVLLFLPCEHSTSVHTCNVCFTLSLNMKLESHTERRFAFLPRLAILQVCYDIRKSL